MPVSFNCPRCNQPVSAPESAIGTPIQCAGCAATLFVPAPKSTSFSAPEHTPSSPAQAESTPARTPPALPSSANAPAVPDFRRAPIRKPAWHLVFRIVNPSIMVLALALLPLPFIEVRCEMDPSKAKGNGANLNPMGMPGGTSVLYTQSGIQSLYGGYSEGAQLQQIKNMGRPQGNVNDPFAPKVNNGQPNKKDDPDPLKSMGPSVAMCGIIATIVVSILITALIPLGAVRSVLAVLCGLGMVGLVVFLFIGGFEIEDEIAKANAKQEAKEKKRRDQLKQNPVVMQPQINIGDPSVRITTAYTMWFWTWVVLIAAGVVVVLIEILCIATTGPSSVRPPPQYEY